MKRLVSFMVALTVMFLSIPSFADTATKFKDGAKSVIMSPMEVYDNVKAETGKAKFLPFGLIGGVLKGGCYMVKDIVTGAWKVVTSPLDMMHK